MRKTTMTGLWTALLSVAFVCGGENLLAQTPQSEDPKPEASPKDPKKQPPKKPKVGDDPPPSGGTSKKG